MTLYPFIVTDAVELVRKFGTSTSATKKRATARKIRATFESMQGCARRSLYTALADANLSGDFSTAMFVAHDED